MFESHRSLFILLLSKHAKFSVNHRMMYLIFLALATVKNSLAIMSLSETILKYLKEDGATTRSWFSFLKEFMKYEKIVSIVMLCLCLYFLHCERTHFCVCLLLQFLLFSLLSSKIRLFYRQRRSQFAFVRPFAL